MVWLQQSGQKTTINGSIQNFATFKSSEIWKCSHPAIITKNKIQTTKTQPWENNCTQPETERASVFLSPIVSIIVSVVVTERLLAALPLLSEFQPHKRKLSWQHQRQQLRLSIQSARLLETGHFSARQSFSGAPVCHSTAPLMNPWDNRDLWNMK